MSGKNTVFYITILSPPPTLQTLKANEIMGYSLRVSGAACLDGGAQVSITNWGLEMINSFICLQIGFEVKLQKLKLPLLVVPRTW